MFENLKLQLIAAAIVSALCLTVGSISAAEDDKPVDTKADNTKTNVRDRNNNELTADNQNQNKNDVEIAAKIRQAVVKDDTLSTNAHNIKIIAKDGMVTLKGPVKNDAEKTAVEKHAMAIVGDKSVRSQIDIAP